MLELEKWNLSSVADFVRENFKTLIGAASLFGAAVTLIFIYAYLSVFDSALIWVLEYPDLLKLLIVGISLVSGIISILMWMAYINFTAKKEPYSKYMKIINIIICIFIIIFCLYSIYFDSSEVNISFIVWFSVFFGIITIIPIANNRFNRFVLLVNLILFVSASGRLYGLRVKNEMPSRSVVVKVQQSQEAVWTNARIVMLLSHHSIFYVDSKTIALPSSEVLRIETSR